MPKKIAILANLDYSSLFNRHLTSNAVNSLQYCGMIVSQNVKSVFINEIIDCTVKT